MDCCSEPGMMMTARVMVVKVRMWIIYEFQKQSESTINHT